MLLKRQFTESIGSLPRQTKLGNWKSTPDYRLHMNASQSSTSWSSLWDIGQTEISLRLMYNRAHQKRDDTLNKRVIKQNRNDRKQYLLWSHVCLLLKVGWTWKNLTLRFVDISCWANKRDMCLVKRLSLLSCLNPSLLCVPQRVFRLVASSNPDMYFVLVPKPDKHQDKELGQILTGVHSALLFSLSSDMKLLIPSWNIICSPSDSFPCFFFIPSSFTLFLLKSRC